MQHIIKYYFTTSKHNTRTFFFYPSHLPINLHLKLTLILIPFIVWPPPCNERQFNNTYIYNNIIEVERAYTFYYFASRSRNNPFAVYTRRELLRCPPPPQRVFYYLAADHKSRAYVQHYLNTHTHQTAAKYFISNTFENTFFLFKYLKYFRYFVFETYFFINEIQVLVRIYSQKNILKVFHQNAFENLFWKYFVFEMLPSSDSHTHASIQNLLLAIVLYITHFIVGSLSIIDGVVYSQLSSYISHMCMILLPFIISI